MVRLLPLVVTQTLMTGFPNWDVMRWLCSPRLGERRASPRYDSPEESSMTLSAKNSIVSCWFCCFLTRLSIYRQISFSCTA
ncbi:hypothetical protein B0H10DRAFT_827468 [Mycena sp. CBHHK59/15]|nr:hypothetical protein B0H10DRAFT_1297029 [Mycena sp. CBHHK59/15]KAJ6587253.1 hypothetical protein B0H10DRAFT_827468 [Mycena sp. CBHHK59/15]